MSDLPWMTDHEAYAAAQPSGYIFGNIRGDPIFIKSFVSAVNERYRSLFDDTKLNIIDSFGPNGQNIGSNEIIPIPQSGFTSLVAKNVFTLANQIPPYDDGELEFVINSRQYQEINSPGWGTTTPTVDGKYWADAVFLDNIDPSHNASGVSWPRLQQIVVGLARSFVINSIDGITEKDYQDTKGDFWIDAAHDLENDEFSLEGLGSFKPRVWIPQKKAYFKGDQPSGISPYVLSNVQDYIDFGFSAEGGFGGDTGGGFPFTNGEQPVSTLPSGWNYLHGKPIDDGNGYTAVYPILLDQFPFPSGFRRKFPLEIWAVENSGIPGQVARFSAFNPDFWGYTDDWTTLNLRNSEINPTVDDINAGIISIFYGHHTGSGFANLVITPKDQLENSGKIYDYMDGSGWVRSPDQTKYADIIEDHGVGVPGDYHGPWILNDLRDAINQLTVTYGYGPNNLNQFIPKPWGGLKTFAAQSFLINFSNKNLSDIEEMNVKFARNPTFEETSEDPSDIYNDIVLDSYNNCIASGNTYVPGKYANFLRQFDSLSDDVQVPNGMYNSYMYIKPSGTSPRSNGTMRKYQFYALSYPEGGTEDNIDDSRNVTYKNYGQDVNFSPSHVDILIAGEIGCSGVQGSWIARKCGEITADHEGYDVGCVFGDTALNPIDESDYVFNDTGGFLAPYFLVLCDWQVTSGYMYTKNSLI